MSIQTSDLALLQGKSTEAGNLFSSNNLSDLASIVAATQNLGLTDSSSNLVYPGGTNGILADGENLYYSQFGDLLADYYSIYFSQGGALSDGENIHSYAGNIVVDRFGQIFSPLGLVVDGSGFVYPGAYTTSAAAGSYVLGALYFDTTHNKLMAGGASAWEAVLTTPLVTTSTPTTGTTISANTANRDETLYINPAGTLAALTISLPAVAHATVGQVIRGFITQIITTLTLNVGGGGTIHGATPTTSAVNSSFSYQCVSVSGTGTWIRLT